MHYKTRTNHFYGRLTATENFCFSLKELWSRLIAVFKLIYNPIPSVFSGISFIVISLFLAGCSGEVKTDIGIHRYFCSSGRIHVDGLVNSSGMTFNPDTGTLFIIQNAPTTLQEVSVDGKLLRSVDVENADDLEGIAYLGKGRFLVAEESSGRLCFFTLGPNDKSVEFDSTIQAAPPTPDNTGLEGVCVDPESGVLYSVEEKRPIALHVVNMKTGKSDIPWDLSAIGVSDVSGICVDPRTEHLLVLSQESLRIVECAKDGRIIATLSLDKKRNGLKKSAGKPEGIAFDPATGRVYVCGEPDMLYVFEKAE